MAAVVSWTHSEHVGPWSHRLCLYSGHRISRLQAVAGLLGRDVTCAVVYDDAAPSWSAWENPWFLGHGDPDRRWAAWQRASPNRALVITQGLVPDAVPANWRHQGAEGDYDGHARALARNLVAAGLGSSVIRLGHEANGTWFRDNTGRTSAELADWRVTWRRIAVAMAGVAGARFRFDWTVSPIGEPVPLDAFYPGDDVVDIVGVDIYDNLVVAAPGLDPAARWRAVMGGELGPNAILRFARSHGKSVSVPEWGLSPVASGHGGGDSPYFVRQMARLFDEVQPAYQAYFDVSGRAGVVSLDEAPLSAVAFRDAFGARR